MSGQAPAPSQASSNASGSSQAPGAAPAPEKGSGGPFDFEKTNQELKGTRAALEKTRGEFGQFKQEAQKDLGILKDLKKMFSGEADKKPSKRETMEAELDELLAAAVDAEKRGTPMPITTKIGAQHYQAQIEAEERYTQQQEVIAKLQQQVELLSNPQRTIDHTAYSHFDTVVRSGLDQLYGTDEAYNGVKTAQFEAVTQQMGEFIKELREKDPKEWDRIRRSPELQKRVANYYMKQNLPPQAVKILEQERLQNTPMKLPELWQAFREAAAIENPEQRTSVRTQIRQQILSHMHKTGKVKVPG